jgi:hypothetical protein
MSGEWAEVVGVPGVRGDKVTWVYQKQEGEKLYQGGERRSFGKWKAVKKSMNQETRLWGLDSGTYDDVNQRKL